MCYRTEIKLAINQSINQLSGHINLTLESNFDVWTLYLKVGPWTLKSVCPNILQASMQNNSFIFSEQINLTWNLETIRLFWPSALSFYRKFKWRVLHIFMAYQPNMEIVHYKVIVTFWPLVLKSYSQTLVWPSQRVFSVNITF